jgi:hypothetical protein
VRETPDEASTDHLLRRGSTVNDTFPPPDAGRHGWADLLRLVDEIRRLAFGILPPIEALGRIRDAYHAYDQQGGM